jgi:hypothetical protein
MLKVFVGMIIGSYMSMMLLGGASAADQVRANVQTLYVDQINGPDGTTTLVLLVVLSISMAALTKWRSKPVLQTEKVSKEFFRWP